jgi:hypothetical protein
MAVRSTEAGRGNRETDAALRYGGTLGGDGSYRLYGMYLDRDHTSTANGARVNDAWHRGQVGFRADWNRPGDQFNLLGNAYRDGLAQPAPGQISISFENIVRGNIRAWGENLTARWSHGLEGGGNLSVQTYYDGTDRTVQPTFGESLDIFDLQVQHSLPAVGNRALVWGAQYPGGPDFRSELANVYEVGYRGLPAARVSYSISVQGHTNGVETWGTYQATRYSRLSAGFVQLSRKLQLKPGSVGPQSALAAGRDPAQSWMLRSSMDLAYQTDVFFKIVGRLR